MDFGSVFGGITNLASSIGSSIYNIFDNERARRDQLKANEIEQMYAERNMQLAEDSYRNGLGTRIADAERNGISKWSVVGDGATFGGSSSPNLGVKGHSDIDAKIDALQFHNMALQTANLKAQNDSLSADGDIKEYNLKWARDHKLPYGQMADFKQNLTNFLTDGTVNEKMQPTIDKAKEVVQEVKQKAEETKEKIKTGIKDKAEKAKSKIKSFFGGKKK